MVMLERIGNSGNSQGSLSCLEHQPIN